MYTQYYKTQLYQWYTGIVLGTVSTSNRFYDRRFRPVPAGFYCSKLWQPSRTGRAEPPVNRQLGFEAASYHTSSPSQSHCMGYGVR